MSYSVSIRTSAVKELRKLPIAARRRDSEIIDTLADNPRPHGVKEMNGMSAWQIRIVDHRVVYSILDSRLVIEIIKIGNRPNIYR